MGGLCGPQVRGRLHQGGARWCVGEPWRGGEGDGWGSVWDSTPRQRGTLLQSRSAQLSAQPPGNSRTGTAVPGALIRSVWLLFPALRCPLSPRNSSGHTVRVVGLRKPSVHNILTTLGSAWFGKWEKLLMLKCVVKGK